MRRQVAAARAVSVLIAGALVMGVAGCTVQGLDAQLEEVSEVTVFAPAAAEQLELSAETSDGARLVRLLAEAEPESAPPGETTPGYSVVFKDGDAVIAMVSFSSGDSVLRLQADEGVSGVASPEFAAEVQRLIGSGR